VPVPLKFTHALALPLITVSDGTDEEPVWLDMVVSLSVLMGYRKNIAITKSLSAAGAGVVFNNLVAIRHAVVVGAVKLF